MLRLHGYPESINARKVLWLIDELGTSVEFVERGTAKAPAHDPEYLRLNRFGLVPLLEDGDFRLAESNTILRYLCRKYERTDLLPSDPRGAAMVERWIDWQATDFNDSWRYAFCAVVRRLPGFDDPAKIAQSKRAFTSKVEIVAAQLGLTQAYVAGPTFTLADVVIGLSLRRWLAMDFDKPLFPEVRRYYELLCERPAFRKFGGPLSPP